MPLALAFLLVLLHAYADYSVAFEVSHQGASRGRHLRQASDSECQKVLWFTAIGARFGRKGTAARYANMVKVAVLSARRNAPSLIPHLIYDGEEGPFTEWYRRHGGIVHMWNLSFFPELRASVDRKEHDAGWLRQYGAYLRIDIPLILAQPAAGSNSSSAAPPPPALRHLASHHNADDSSSSNSVHAHGISSTAPAGAAARRLLLKKKKKRRRRRQQVKLLSDPSHFGPDVLQRFVLYTDSDVMFRGDVNSCNLPQPNVMSMGPEFQRGTVANSGVLVMNVPRVGGEHAAIVQHGVRTGWRGIVDQTLLLEYFGPRLSRLPDGFNWKPYWGASPLARVIHFHGLKPSRCLTCLLSGTKPLKCSCPGVYVWIWTDHLVDGGAFYKRCLREFQKYLAQAQGGAAGGGSEAIAAAAAAEGKLPGRRRRRRTIP